MTSRTAKDSVAVDLCAVITAASPKDARVLTISAGPGAAPALPAGPLAKGHRTLELGLRNWVAEQANAVLGYVEQLYTFGDEGRTSPTTQARRVLSIGYLALVREAQPTAGLGAHWRSWYDFFPWEDWRGGPPEPLEAIRSAIAAWERAAATYAERRDRRSRAAQAFAATRGAWNDERVLERYELLYEIGFVPEAQRDRKRTAARPPAGLVGIKMFADHRRILATGVARLRSKIKYRPLVFELMPPAFTFLQLQQTVEALAGVRLHKPNFRRLVEQQGLVESTGALSTQERGRPAKVWRFRAKVLEERPAPGVKSGRAPAPSERT
ncbi:MAG: hypothetical protein O3A88_02835 [Proteobacteria bacterium]|nr:hypothetical protein [Pseudomonadota bacterium]